MVLSTNYPEMYEEVHSFVWPSITVSQCVINGGMSEGFVKRNSFRTLTIMEKSPVPFSLGGENLKRYFDQR